MDKYFLIFLLSFFSFKAFSEGLPMLLDHKKEDALLPVTFYLNSSFDVIQNPYYFSQDDYFEKHKTMFKRITSPFHSIEKDGGYKKFFEDEFLTSRVVPNIGLHMIGAAYDNLYMYQYFKERNYPAPFLFMTVLSYLGHFGNEALELTNSNITSHDNIADLFIFDVISFYLAFNPAAMNFLVEDLQMETWHFQPMYNIKESDVANTGLNYIFRPDLFKAKLRPFIFMGMQNMLGGSYEFKENEFITAAFGMALTDPLEQKGKFVTGLFYDKNQSLYYSLFLNGSEDYRVRFNLYPESLAFKKLKIGLLVGQKKNRAEVIGININLPFGLVFTN